MKWNGRGFGMVDRNGEQEEKGGNNSMQRIQERERERVCVY